MSNGNSLEKIINFKKIDEMQMVEDLGISRATLWNFKTKNKISLTILKKISSYMNVSIDAILKHPDEIKDEDMEEPKKFPVIGKYANYTQQVLEDSITSSEEEYNKLFEKTYNQIYSFYEVKNKKERELHLKTSEIFSRTNYVK